MSPYPYLQKAYKLLFTAKAGSPFALTLTGTVVSAAIDRIVVNVSTSQAWPSGLTLTKLNRTIALTVPETTTVQSLSPTGGLRTVANVTLAAEGRQDRRLDDSPHRRRSRRSAATTTCSAQR